MANLTGLELALIPAGAALVGVLLGITGNAYLEARKDRRAATRERDQAIAEFLTASADLIAGVQAVRTAYYRRYEKFFHYIRLGAVLISAVGSVMAGSDNFAWGKLLDWRTGGPLFDRLLVTDRELDDKQRTIALDLAAILTPRTNRFFAAATVLTLGPDKRIVKAARELTPAVTELLEVIAASPKKYGNARTRAEKALGDFRTVADQRDQ